jgi:aspartate aminotransferase
MYIILVIYLGKNNLRGLHMNLNKRVQNLKPSAIRKLLPFAAEAKKNGKKVYHLNMGQPDISTPEEFFQALKNYNTEIVSYAPSSGHPELISEVIKYYSDLSINYDTENIFVTNGGSEAFAFALMSICNELDEVLMPEPYYSNYNTYMQLYNIKSIPIKTKSEDGFHLPSKSEIEKLITPRTKAILVSNPGNPTGTVYTEDEVRMLADIACENNIFIISDEVYREFVYDKHPYLSFAALDYIKENLILIDSISKRFSTCGARIGFLLTKNKELQAAFFQLCQARLAAPIVEQVAATALYQTPKSYLESVIDEYAQRRNLVYECLSTMEGVVCKKPEGAFYIMATLPVDNAETFIKWMLLDFNYCNETLMLAPAYGFYSTDGLGLNQVRIAYVLNQDDLKQSMKILSEALKEYSKQRKK